MSLIGRLARPFVMVTHDYDLSNINKILVFKIGALGDVLMTTPFLMALRKRFPKAQIDYWVGKAYSGVLEGNKNINRVVGFDDRIFYKKNIFKAMNLLKEIKKENYDIAFILDKSDAINLFIYKTKIPIRVGFDRYGEGYPNTINAVYGHFLKHEIEYYLDLAYAVGAKKELNLNIDLSLSKEDEKFAESALKGIKNPIAIIPGGAHNPGVGDDPVRRWPADKFIELINRLPGKYSIILMGKGKSDVDLNNYVASRLTMNVLDFTDRTSIKQTAALLKRCRYVICNDSGPMHMASAVNKHVISLWGASNPNRKAPMHKESVAIWKDESRYDPGYDIFGRKPKGSFMQDITVEDVLQHIR